MTTITFALSAIEGNIVKWGHHRVSGHRGCVCGTFYTRAVCHAALKKGPEQIPDQFNTLIGHEACSQAMKAVK
ncbi:hypothetical protein HBH56_141010 [Parastagonospora nodorum]|nr:hypothetical protein HBH56_141010 [Parastagonospora nodorum]KAH3928071.1 hypothetical protein HBH54_146150 [Parastagonospora nodorum]KAH3949142.1 hypothetical protein HBH53_096150 [Parastagonospora nodorum]KAH4061352.1 hypothetical protein HBH49_014120 [Parastagonospora nodorum]KAH4072907.1 hypothetical protein HBH50_065970 [Parastagonospora nodorum]